MCLAPGEVGPINPEAWRLDLDVLGDHVQALSISNSAVVPGSNGWSRTPATLTEGLADWPDLLDEVIKRDLDVFAILDGRYSQGVVWGHDADTAPDARKLLQGRSAPGPPASRPQARPPTVQQAATLVQAPLTAGAPTAGRTTHTPTQRPQLNATVRTRVHGPHLSKSTRTQPRTRTGRHRGRRLPVMPHNPYGQCSFGIHTVSLAPRSYFVRHPGVRHRATLAAATQTTYRPWIRSCRHVPVDRLQLVAPRREC